MNDDGGESWAWPSRTRLSRTFPLSYFKLEIPLVLDWTDSMGRDAAGCVQSIRKVYDHFSKKRKMASETDRHYIGFVPAFRSSTEHP